MKETSIENICKQRELLNQTLHGKINKVVDDIKEALKENNIDATPEIAMDACTYAIKELHMERLNHLFTGTSYSKNEAEITLQLDVEEIAVRVSEASQKRMTNYEALKQMPINSFANMIYTMATRDCKTLQEFEALLCRQFPEEGKEALQDLRQKGEGSMRT